MYLPSLDNVRKAGLGGFSQISSLGVVQCFEGYWQRDPGVPGQADRPDILQLLGAPEETQFWPFGALVTEDGHDLVIHTALRQTVREERYEENGIPVVRAGYFNTEESHAFQSAVDASGYVAFGGYFRICGPVVQGADGIPQLVVQSFEGLTPPSARPPEPIEVRGTLERYMQPGVPIGWPMVAGWVVTSSRDWPTDAAYQFAQRWNAGTMPVGSEVRIVGYPRPDASPVKEIIPLDFTVLTRGEGEPDPRDVDLPEAAPAPPPDLPEPPPYDPDPWDDIPRPEIDPKDWDLDGDGEDIEPGPPNGGGGGDLPGPVNGGAPPSGGGAPTPDGTPPGGEGEEGARFPSVAGFGPLGTAAIVGAALVFVFGTKKKRPRAQTNWTL